MNTSDALSDLRHGRRPFLPNEVRPNPKPRFLAKQPAFEDTAAGVFQLSGHGGIHVPSARQALVQIRVADAEGISESAPNFRGDFSAHMAHLSDSLQEMQAIRYEDASACMDSKSLENAGVETNNERRKRKLAELCEIHGITDVAKVAKLSPVYVEQILKGVKLPEKGDGSRSERALGETAARAIEEAYELGRGWFDNDGDDIKMNALEMTLVGYFRQLGDAGLQQVVIDNLREAVEDRNRLAEKLKYTKPAELRSGELQGGISQVGEFNDQAVIRGRK